MVEIHELLERDLDPIDDVQRRFESSYTDDYFDPTNGDWISDDYYRIIDLTTKPGPLSEDEAGKLGRSITRLNDKHDYIERLLGSSILIGAYNEIAGQVNTVNSANSKREDVPRMLMGTS